MFSMKLKPQYLIPSISDMLFLALLFSMMFFTGKNLLNDCDTGYHIRAGEFILNNQIIPKQDIFSFLSPPLPWKAHEWLSEVIMALVFRASGLTGEVLFFALVISLTYYCFCKILCAERKNAFLTIIITLLAIASSQLHWLARPHIFSLGLLLYCYHLLDDFHYRGRNRLYILPLLMLLWVNLHGGYIAGFVLLSVYFVNSVIDYLIAPAYEKGASLLKSRNLMLVTIFSLLAALANPSGYHILLFPFKLVSDTYIMDHIMEFLSPNFHESLPFKYFFLLMIGIVAWSQKRLNFIELTLMLFFTYMALYSVRYIPLLAVIAAPIMVRQSARFIEKCPGRTIDFVKRRAAGISALDNSARGYLWPVAGIAVVVFMVAHGRVNYTFDPEKKPVAAVEFLNKEHIAGNMFNNDEFGDYIIYAAWPRYKVFFDGRSDMYGADRLREYNKICSFENDWALLLKKHRINWIIFDADSTLSRYLLINDSWRLIYSDRVANIFVRNSPEYKYLIDKYQNVRATR